MVSPLARYRPAVLAHALVTFDRLSGGRTVLGVGLGGVAREYLAFGESADPRKHAAIVDEALAVLDRLWSGEAVTHRGRHYAVEGVSLAPLPLQQPRIPVWVGGASGPARRRAARWDGWVIDVVDQDGKIVRSPEQIAADVATIRRERDGDVPFDVAVVGQSDPGDRRLRREYADAGATWWLEIVHGLRGPLEAMLARAAAGPGGDG